MRVELKACIAIAIVFGVAEPLLAQDVFAPPGIPLHFPASPTSAAIAVDGRLDEAAWASAEQIADFVQKEPEQGAPSSHQTLVRVTYDDQALYVAAICMQPRDTIRVQSLERDFSFDENDLFGVAIDGIGDHRSAVAFQTTPFGSQRDLEAIDGDKINSDWDARWDVATRIEDDRWIVEMEIPWSTLRYPAGADRLGIVFARNIRHRNENVSAPAVPRVFTIYKMDYQGELAGLKLPSPSANVTINPYILGSRFSGGSSADDINAGGEVKWAVTPNTVLDATVNTDFAQVEVDRQVVNLERFSVFFPERRQFFLENAGLFDASVTRWIRPFFSRRIGLDRSGGPIPLDGGLRLTSRSSGQEFGLLAMSQEQAGDSPAALFAVARYSRNLQEQSRVGGMITYRKNDDLVNNSVNQSANDNVTYTIDGLWRPNQTFGLQAMVSASHDDVVGNGIGGQLWAYYENNWLYAGWLEYYNKDYEPGIGLEILDTNYVMHSPALSLDLRPDWLPDSVRSFNPSVTAYVFESSDNGDLLFAYAPIQPIRLHFQNGGQFGLVVEPNWQRLERSFFPAGIEVAVGDYDYTRFRLDWETDQSAPVSLDMSVEAGDYFDGSLTTYSASVRYAPFPQLELIADVDVNQFRALGVSQVDDETEVFGLNLRVAPNPRLQFSLLYQHNSVGSRDNLNARLSWEYKPLSYLYLVYNRNEVSGLVPSRNEETQQVILKLTYLFEV